LEISVNVSSSRLCDPEFSPLLPFDFLELYKTSPIKSIPDFWLKSRSFCRGLAASGIPIPEASGELRNKRSYSTEETLEKLKLNDLEYI